MVWSASRVRRRLRIPAHEPLLAWVPAVDRGMQVPFPVTGSLRAWPPYLVLTDEALWVSRAGVSERFGLERVVMASLVDEPVGGLRVDFLSGDPLVAVVPDGGSFFHRLVREIRSFDRELQYEAVAARRGASRSWSAGPDRGSDPAGPGPMVPGPDGGGRVAVDRYPDEVWEVLHEAKLIAVRELRLVLTELAESPGDQTAG